MIFFLSCTNEKKFYQRKEKEFKNSILKNFSSKINKFVDNPNENSNNKEELPRMMEELDQEDDAYLDEKISVHLFLEDLKECSKVNKPLLAQAQKGINDISHLMKQMKDKMLALGNTFNELSQSFKEIEKTKRPEILEINPLHSRIYHELKMSFSRWSNLFEHEHKHLEKLFVPTVKLLRETNKKNLENLTIRTNMINKLIHTIDKVKKGKDNRNTILDKKELMFGSKELVFISPFNY